MRKPFVGILVGLLLSSCLTGGYVFSDERPTPARSSSVEGVKSDYFRMEPVFLVTFNVPKDDVDEVLGAVTAKVPLQYGFYDHVAYLDAPGEQQYRPREGSRAGPREKDSRASSIRVSFSIPRDQLTLRTAVDAIWRVHPYEEPVIYVDEAWRSRSLKRDEDNPHRWWNRKKK